MLQKGHTLLKGTSALLFAALTATVAHATPVSTNTWYEFSFTTPGTPASTCTYGNCMPSSGTPSVAAGFAPYTLTVAGTDTLLVQDAFLAGDVFEVYDSGTLIGSTTSVAGNTAYSCGDDPAVCSEDPAMSQGAFLLGAGLHSLSFVPTESVINTGAAYFEVIPNAAASVTPEPSALVLLGTGVLGIAGTLRRRLQA